MNRASLKEKAKEMIRGNKWYIWKPLLIFFAISIALSFIGGALDEAFGLASTEIIEIGGEAIEYTEGGVFTGIASIILGLFGYAFNVGYAKYILGFVRGTKLELKDIIDFMKKHWVLSFLVGLLVSLNTIIGCVLLIVPGIIAALGLFFYKEVCADNPDKSTTEVLKEVWSITNGYKVDIFVMCLSFIGWAILAGLTFGILYIWLIPYITVAFTLAYEELRTK